MSTDAQILDDVEASGGDPSVVTLSGRAFVGACVLVAAGILLVGREMPDPIGPPDLAPVAGPPATLAGDAANPPPAKAHP